MNLIGHLRVRPEWITDDADDYLAICFQRRKNAEAHADFVVEFSGDLLEWIDDPSLLEPAETTAYGPGLEEVTIYLRANTEDCEYSFLRLTLREKVAAELRSCSLTFQCRQHSRKYFRDIEMLRYQSAPVAYFPSKYFHIPLNFLNRLSSCSSCDSSPTK